MANEILPYIEMCQRKGVSLQRGMKFELGGNHSTILMSVRPGAPYADRFEDDGSTVNLSRRTYISFLFPLHACSLISCSPFWEWGIFLGY